MALSHVKLKTTGMHCMSCAALVQMNVGELEGVENVRADLTSGMTDVDFDSDKVGVDRIVAEIVKAGYGAEVAG